MYVSNPTIYVVPPANYDRVLWGVCMTGMGYVTDFSSLMTARFFLGLAEAGLFPGVSYYLSCWYRRSEIGVRLVSKTGI